MSLEVIPRGVSPFQSKTLHEMFDLFLQAHGPYAFRTILNKRIMFVNSFLNKIGNAPITKDLLLSWSFELGNRLGVAKYNQTTVTVKQVLKWLYKIGYLAEDHTAIVPYKRMPAPKPALTWTHEEYEQMKAYCKVKPHFQTHLWLFILAYRTGMSLVDCCHLRWRDVHMHDNGPSFIDIYRIKTERLGVKALCQIPIIPHTDLHDALLSRKAVAHLNYKRFDGITDFVHEDAPGLYMNTMNRIGDDFGAIWDRAGIVRNGRSFRHFRNTFVSNLVNSGMQLALLTKITGHNNLQTLLLYLKADRYALQDGLAKAYEYGSNPNGSSTITATIPAPDKQTGPAQVNNPNPEV